MSCTLGVFGTETPAGKLFIEQLALSEAAIDELVNLALDPYEVDPVSFRKQKVFPKAVADFDFSKLDIVVIFEASDEHDKFLQRALDANCYVIDCTATDLGDQPSVFIVPEVNVERLADISPGIVIKNPYSSSIFLSMLLKPLLNHAQIESVSAVCLLPAITFGKAGVDELVGQTAKLLNGLPVKNTAFPQQLTFNTLAQSGDADSAGFSSHENCLVEQTRQLLTKDELAVYPTCIIAPVFYAQSLSLSISLASPIPASTIDKIYKKMPGIRYTPTAKQGPSAVSDATGKNDLYVGRVRQWQGKNQQLSVWCVADELRKGVAVNAVQIAEILIKSYL